MAVGDTIVAVASAPGRSARGIVRLSGAGTREALAQILADPPRPFDRGGFPARLRAGIAGSSELPLLVAAYRAPRSYTGEDAAELVLPGNPIVLERMVRALCALPGVRQASPGEFTARAFLAERLTLEQAEGVAAVIAAETEEELTAGRELLEGQRGAMYAAWGDELALLLALVEAGIDFVDQEDVVAIDPAELKSRLQRLIAEVESFLGGAQGAEALHGLAQVVLAGRPNAGKSTLFNALLGRRRAVVSDLAGTTRDVLEEQLDLRAEIPGAGAVLLIDLAGLDASGEAWGHGGESGQIHAQAQHAAREAVGSADVVVWCDPRGEFAGREMAGLPRTPVIRVRTKADLPGQPGLSGDDAIAVCALDGWNLAVLRRAIADAAYGAARASGGAVVWPRHRRALDSALQGMRGAVELEDAELVAQRLREALDALGELIGHISPDDIVGRIFATFCVGK
jgi:tRNA modification GTPase